MTQTKMTYKDAGVRWILQQDVSTGIKKKKVESCRFEVWPSSSGSSNISLYTTIVIGLAWLY